MTFTPEVWDGVVRRLRLELPPFICDAFIANLTAEPSGDGVRIQCPTAFHRDRVRDHYRQSITECLSAELGRRPSVEITTAESKRVVVATTPSQRSSPMPVPPRRHGPRIESVNLSPARAGAGADSAHGASPAKPTSHPVGRRADASRPVVRPVQRPLLRSGQTFESFVVGDCNALAREASIAMLRQDDPNLSRLFLCSPHGLGKTHLAKAICAEARANGLRPVYTSAEAFTNEFLASLRSRQTGRFKRKFRQECDVLVVEDVAFFQGKESTQLEFFHTVQHVRDAGGRTIFTGGQLPQELTSLDSRVRSQLADGFVAELGPPDAQVRREILRAKAAAGGVHLPDESVEMLVEAIRGSVRDLENVLIQLVTTASLLKKKIDRALTQEALDKKGASGGSSLPRLQIADVISLVAGSFQTTADEMAGKSRRKEILVPRQLAMYLCRRYTDASLTEIGRALNRDHPSVRNAISKIERAILEKAPLRYQVEELARQLGCGERR
jgi:chromosomal replication initiator protein